MPVYMDVPGAWLLDLGINLLGYALGATALYLLSRLFSRKKAEQPRTSKTTLTRQPEQSAEVKHGSAESRSTYQSPAFVSFAKQERTAPLSRVVAPANGMRRNRLETLGLAREMLVAGATLENIKRVLPISDGEVALLRETVKVGRGAR